MKLNPRTPPGRSNRKARAFSEEIARLHFDGYGLVAIREALADVGVSVSTSTVQREVARLSKSGIQSGRRIPTPVIPPSIDSDDSRPCAPIQHRLTNERRSGKDVAEAFMKGRITNPLICTRS